MRVTQVPTLVLTADTFDMLWPSTGRKVLDAWAQRAVGGGAEVHVLHVCGSKHQNFADFTALAPDITQVMGLAGERDPHAVLAFVNALDVRLPAHDPARRPLQDDRLLEPFLSPGAVLSPWCL